MAFRRELDPLGVFGPFFSMPKRGTKAGSDRKRKAAMSRREGADNSEDAGTSQGSLSNPAPVVGLAPECSEDAGTSQGSLSNPAHAAHAQVNMVDGKHGYGVAGASVVGCLDTLLLVGDHVSRKHNILKTTMVIMTGHKMVLYLVRKALFMLLSGMVWMGGRLRCP